MISSAKASAVGTVGRSDARVTRRALVWFAVVLAALAVAATVAFAVHRTTESTGTGTTQQQSVPQVRAADPSRRLIEINEAPGSNAAPAAPVAPAHRAPSRLQQLNQ